MDTLFIICYMQIFHNQRSVGNTGLDEKLHTFKKPNQMFGHISLNTENERVTL